LVSFIVDGSARGKRQGSGWVPCNGRSLIISAYRDEFANASKTAQRKIAETEETGFQFQNEFAKTFEEMSRAVILREPNDWAQLVHFLMSCRPIRSG
jgi:hypothetical protein